MLLFICSCASKQESITKIEQPIDEVQAPVVPEKQPGSLWSESNKSMFGDHKAKRIGDIVTVVISESSSATKSASTSTDRTTSASAGIPSFLGLENSVSSSLNMSNLMSANFANDFEGAGKTVRSGNLSASLTAQVVGLYPNGNIKIRGGKEVMVNNEVQIIYLTGIIRPVDITAANTVASTKVLNARITYTGKGAVADKQKPGWGTRIIDNVWPF